MWISTKENFYSVAEWIFYVPRKILWRFWNWWKPFWRCQWNLIEIYRCESWDRINWRWKIIQKENPSNYWNFCSEIFSIVPQSISLVLFLPSRKKLQKYFSSSLNRHHNHSTHNQTKSPRKSFLWALARRRKLFFCLLWKFSTCCSKKN